MLPLWDFFRKEREKERKLKKNKRLTDFGGEQERKREKRQQQLSKSPFLTVNQDRLEGRRKKEEKRKTAHKVGFSKNRK